MGSGKGGSEARNLSPSSPEYLEKIRIEKRKKIYQILLPKVKIIFKYDTVSIYYRD
jgi:hypothetical protein